VTLGDDRMHAREPSPMDSVRELVAYVEELLDEQRQS
jgi:hypothetical protein